MREKPRWLARLAVLALTLAAGVLGLAAPAAAADPTVTFVDKCGAVEVTISPAVDVVLTSNGAYVRGFVAAAWPGSVLIGASKGDTIGVQIGATVTNHPYDQPSDCDFPDITFTFENACQGVLLVHADNNGPGPASGFKIFSAVTDELAPFPVGESTQSVTDLSSGIFQLGNFIDSALAIWATGSYAEPEGCGPETVHASFTDDCGKLHVNVTSDIEAPQFYVVVKNPDGPGGVVVAIGVVSSSAPGSHDVTVVGGDKVAVYYPDHPAGDGPALTEGQALAEAFPVTGFTLIGTHTHVAPVCAALAVTGDRVGLVAGIGALLIFAGALTVLLVRRRRIGPTANA